jgi:hypothetical protein
MAKKKSNLGNPKNKPCNKFKTKQKHKEHHHTEGGGFNYCDGYPDPLNRKNYG